MPVHKVGCSAVMAVRRQLPPDAAVDRHVEIQPKHHRMQDADSMSSKYWQGSP